MTEHPQIITTLRGIAARLTSDIELQKDLTQEMFLHFVQVEEGLPGQTPTWYFQSCRFCARNILRRGRSIDSLKRRNYRVPLGPVDDDDEWGVSCHEPADPLDLRSKVIARDIIALLVPQLTDAQQRILFLLIHGFGVREIARQLQVSHPAVIKHRRQIAKVATSLLTDCNGGWSGNPARVNGAAASAPAETAAAQPETHLRFEL